MNKNDDVWLIFMEMEKYPRFLYVEPSIYLFASRNHLLLRESEGIVKVPYSCLNFWTF
jgi:hypothetical protein